jgi:hypothetical protein
MHENKGFPWKKELAVPMILMLFAGIVGVGVGYTWEFFKFKRETLFEKRIDLIMDSRRQAADVFIEFDRLRRQIESNEKYFAAKGSGSCDPENLTSQVEELKALGLRLNYLDEFSKGIITSDEVSGNIRLFKEQLKGYLDCLKTNTKCTICTAEYPELMPPLQKIIELHTNEINSQIRLSN